MVVPTRNEAGVIESVLIDAKPFANEILVVDGGSTDGTAEIATAVPGVTVLCIAGGKGRATRVALERARGDVVVFMDGDGSHDVRDIPRLAAPISDDRAELVIASRVTGGSDEFDDGRQHVLRRAGTLLATGMMNARFGARLTDALNGFRACKRVAVTRLPLSANGFEIEVELLALALRSGLRVTEIPSREHRRRWGSSKFPTAQGLPYLFRLLKYLVWHSSPMAQTEGALQAKRLTLRGTAARTGT